MFGEMKAYLQQQLDDVREAGLEKKERVIETPQSANIEVQGGAAVLNLCANNYLGLADHPDVVAAADDRQTLGAGRVELEALGAGDRNLGVRTL